MARTRIKICGLTSVDAARAASACGVDAIGLVFHAESPRHVSASRAAEISELTEIMVSAYEDKFAELQHFESKLVELERRKRHLRDDFDRLKKLRTDREEAIDDAETVE